MTNVVVARGSCTFFGSVEPEPCYCAVAVEFEIRDFVASAVALGGAAAATGPRLDSPRARGIADEIVRQGYAYSAGRNEPRVTPYSRCRLGR